MCIMIRVYTFCRERNPTTRLKINRPLRPQKHLFADAMPKITNDNKNGKTAA